jgi:hypothetical protein
MFSIKTNKKIFQTLYSHCAVGNLIAYNSGTYRFQNKTGGDSTEWVSLVNLIRSNSLVDPKPSDFLSNDSFRSIDQDGNTVGRERDLDVAYNQIYLSGYSLNEIERIEAAFERVQVGPCNIGVGIRRVKREDDPKEGLLRAIEVLGKIHEIPEETVTCMKEKIQDKTYKKSFELITPENTNWTISNEDVSH